MVREIGDMSHHGSKRRPFLVDVGQSTLSASLLVPAHPFPSSHPHPLLELRYPWLHHVESRCSRYAVQHCTGSDCVVVVELLLTWQPEWERGRNEGMNLPNQTRATSGARKREDPCLPLAISAVLRPRPGFLVWAR